MIKEYRKDDYLITTDPERVDMDVVVNFLTTAYWAELRSRSKIERAVSNSLPFSIYHGEKQVGFARVVSDHAIFAYLMDVFVIEEYRGRGLSKWLMNCIFEYPNFYNVKKWALATGDAHGLYRKFGFESITDEKLAILMEREAPNYDPAGP